MATYIHTLAGMGRIYRCKCGAHLREARLVEPCCGCGHVNMDSWFGVDDAVDSAWLDIDSDEF